MKYLKGLYYPPDRTRPEEVDIGFEITIIQPIDAIIDVLNLLSRLSFDNRNNRPLNAPQPAETITQTARSPMQKLRGSQDA